MGFISLLIVVGVLMSSQLFVVSLGAVFSVVLGIIAKKKGILSKSGSMAAVLMALLSLFTGWQSFVVLAVFFLSSSLLTKWRTGDKTRMGVAQQEIGRNWRQVLGAGGVAALISATVGVVMILGFSNPGTHIANSLFVAMLACVAASNADTWAIEIGVMSKRKPRLILRPWIEVPVGTSGGVTLLGELASATGSLTISSASYIIYTFSRVLHATPWVVFDVNPHRLFLWVFFFGWFGEILDSLIGSTIQARYFCPVCKKITEKKSHGCGSRTIFSKGIKLVSNETTNLLSTSAVALLVLVTHFYSA